MKKKTAVGIIVSCIVAVSLAVAALNPLRSSPEIIRMSLLEATPLGSGIDVVLDLAKDRGWRSEQRRTGFVRDTDVQNVVGVSSVHLSLGEYHEIPIPLATSVEAFCAFDAAGKLVDVWVRKSTDAP